MTRANLRHASDSQRAAQSYGAALLAGVGAGFWPTVDAACSANVRVASSVIPQPAAVATLNASYAAFRRVYSATKGIFTSH